MAFISANHMKIIICGPPHSGKTVMVDSLNSLLPTERVQTIRANGDGEGYWSNGKDQAAVDRVREKGTNTDKDFAKWAGQIREAKADIVLVDIGGKLQEDKAPLFDAADSFVVLCSDAEPELMRAWKEFGESHMCRCIACITSTREGEESVGDQRPGAVIRGTLAHLDRGTTHTDSKLLKALADRIIELAGHATPLRLDSQTLDAFEMAYALGCYTERESGGGPCRTLLYKAGDKGRVRGYVAAWQAERGLKSVRVYGATAGWVAVLTVLTLADGGAEDIELFDVGTWRYVRLRRLRVAAGATGSPLCITVRSFDSGRDIMEVRIAGEGGKPRSLDVGELGRCAIPPTDARRGIVVSGRLPLWLLASICLTLPNDEICVHRPGAGGDEEVVSVRG